MTLRPGQAFLCLFDVFLGLNYPWCSFGNAPAQSIDGVELGKKRFSPCELE
ncbi:hypothetical protein [Olsenella uli]|uniref:hypothetical protein n=1 Tax=Olsenella uli TaxID=133926 RepID=UPI003D79C168